MSKLTKPIDDFVKRKRKREKENAKRSLVVGPEKVHRPTKDVAK